MLLLSLRAYPCNWSAWMVGGMCECMRVPAWLWRCHGVVNCHVPRPVLPTLCSRRSGGSCRGRACASLLKRAHANHVCPLQALQRLVTDAATLRALPSAPGLLPQHWAADFFLASACLELQVAGARGEGGGGQGWDCLQMISFLRQPVRAVAPSVHAIERTRLCARSSQENMEALSKLQRLSHVGGAGHTSACRSTRASCSCQL